MQIFGLTLFSLFLYKFLFIFSLTILVTFNVELTFAKTDGALNIVLIKIVCFTPFDIWGKKGCKLLQPTVHMLVSHTKPSWVKLLKTKLNDF